MTATGERLPTSQIARDAAHDEELAVTDARSRLPGPSLFDLMFTASSFWGNQMLAHARLTNEVTMTTIRYFRHLYKATEQLCEFSMRVLEFHRQMRGIPDSLEELSTLRRSDIPVCALDLVTAYRFIKVFRIDPLKPSQDGKSSNLP